MTISAPLRESMDALQEQSDGRLVCVVSRGLVRVHDTERAHRIVCTHPALASHASDLATDALRYLRQNPIGK